MHFYFKRRYAIEKETKKFQKQETSFVIQHILWKQLNVITLVQGQSDNINRMITLSEHAILMQFAAQLEKWLLASILVCVKANRTRI